MSETFQLNLPLLMPSQAQKHVTVNEGLARLDALAQINLQSRTLSVPPSTSHDGTSYGVPAGASGAWSGRIGKIAIFSNGDWIFATPRTGWRAWIVDEFTMAVFDGGQWRAGALAFSANGASSVFRVIEFTHTIGAGTVSTPSVRISETSMVFAVSARVLSNVTGTLVSWQLGSAGNPNRFGSGLGLTSGSFTWGLLSSPTTYYAATDLILTATGGNFSGGSVRLAIHALNLTLPF